MKRIPRSQPGQTGFSLPEVMVASFILILVVLSSLQMTGSSILGMGRSKQRGLVDADIASHMETLREGAFRYLCTQGCANTELTKSLAFDLATLKPLCSDNNLGQGLLNARLARLADSPTLCLLSLHSHCALPCGLESVRWRTYYITGNMDQEEHVGRLNGKIVTTAILKEAA